VLIHTVSRVDSRSGTLPFMSNFFKKIQQLCLGHIQEKKSQLMEFHYARFIWALRSMLAAISSLIMTYFYPYAGIWLISSSAIGLQLYAYADTTFKKKYVCSWGILLAVCSTIIALFSKETWVLYVIVTAVIVFAFYFGHRSNTHAMFGLWSAVLIIVSAFFPIECSQWLTRLTPMIIGTALAFLCSYLTIDKNRNETIPTPIHFNSQGTSKKLYVKYAIKGGLVALLSLIVAQLLHIQYAYWILFGAVTVIKLQTDVSLRRGTERIYGTLLGVGISLLLALCLLHWPLGIAIIIPLCIFGAVYYLPYYSLGMMFITILFVLTFGITTHDPIHYGMARIMDTSIGVVLALAVSYMLWPYKAAK
jgi:uncharacterized membrane protein YccC